MKIPGKYIFIEAVFLIALVAGNIYQYRNPKIVSVPELVPAKIDSSTWIARSAYTSRGHILDSLQKVNRQLSERIRKSKNQIANVTSIAGRLKTKLDSLQRGKPEKKIIQIKPGVKNDTSFVTQRTFGNHLFQVSSTVHFKYWVTWKFEVPQLHYELWNDLDMQQLRNVKINVVTTEAKNNKFMLVYVNSPDFSNLTYSSRTALKPHKKLPTFWIGSGVTLLLLGIVKFVIH